MKKLLIITTINDLSIPLFLVNEVSNLIDVKFCFFHESLSIIKNKIESTNFDCIYIRDPFTGPYNENDLKNKLNFIINNSPKTYLIDNVKSPEDVYFEDKWFQYRIFSRYMLPTYLLSDLEDNKKNLNYIIKKRISSRSKGIVFNKEAIPEKNVNDYIIQEKIDIEKEYRVYVIFNEIIETVGIKSSKTDNSKAKVINAEKINRRLKEFVQKIIVNNKFDLLGLDVALAQDQYYLIEINRSPQFIKFYTQTQINIAEFFVKKLLEKRLP